jgi:hypothetical protein
MLFDALFIKMPATIQCNEIEVATLKKQELKREKK